MTKIVFYLALFWIVQAVVNLCFKYSSVHEHRFLFYFILGHAIGIPSLLLLVQLYKVLPEPIAFGLASGGAFMAVQIALYLLFRPSVTPVQWAGALAICAGMVLLAAGGSRRATPADPGAPAPAVAAVEPVSP